MAYILIYHHLTSYNQKYILNCMYSKQSLHLTPLNYVKYDLENPYLKLIYIKQMKSLILYENIINMCKYMR
jgi:hypothetical protein